MQRAATLCENQQIEKSNLEFLIMTSVPSSKTDISSADVIASQDSHDLELTADFSLEKHLEAIEIEAIEKALEETRWNRTAAAKKLGMSFRSLRYRLKKLGLD